MSLFFGLQRDLILFFSSVRAWVKEEFGETATSWTYRYNKRNPTSAGTGVYHAAENWLMFKGTNTGYVLCIVLFQSINPFASF